jgi:hypothetical protein
MPDSKMMIRADAKAIGMVTALSTTNRRKPRTYPRASDCITYTYKGEYVPHKSMDERDRTGATIFKSARAEKRATSKRSSSASAPKRYLTSDDHRIMRELPAINTEY